MPQEYPITGTVIAANCFFSAFGGRVLLMPASPYRVSIALYGEASGGSRGRGRVLLAACLLLAHLDHMGEIIGAPGQHPAEPLPRMRQRHPGVVRVDPHRLRDDHRLVTAQQEGERLLLAVCQPGDRPTQ